MTFSSSDRRVVGTDLSLFSSVDILTQSSKSAGGQELVAPRALWYNQCTGYLWEKQVLKILWL